VIAQPADKRGGDWAADGDVIHVVDRTPLQSISQLQAVHNLKSGDRSSFRSNATANCNISHLRWIEFQIACQVRFTLAPILVGGLE